MSKRPFFTIFSAERNANYFAAHNLVSLFAQTFTDWELFLVDDASTDSTPRIIQHTADLALGRPVSLVMNRTRQFKLQNFLTVFPRMRGEVIIDLDGDDRFSLPTALQTIHDAYQRPRVDATFGYFRCDLWATWGGVDFKMLPLRFDIRQPQMHPTPRTFRRSLIERLLAEVPSAVVDPTTHLPWRVSGEEVLYLGAIAFARRALPIRDILVDVTRTNGQNHDFKESPEEQLDSGRRITEFWHDWAARSDLWKAGGPAQDSVPQNRDAFLARLDNGLAQAPHSIVSGGLTSKAVDRWLGSLVDQKLIAFESHDPLRVRVTDEGRWYLTTLDNV